MANYKSKKGACIETSNKHKGSSVIKKLAITPILAVSLWYLGGNANLQAQNGPKQEIHAEHGTELYDMLYDEEKAVVIESFGKKSELSKEHDRYSVPINIRIGETTGTLEVISSRFNINELIDYLSNTKEWELMITQNSTSKDLEYLMMCNNAQGPDEKFYLSKLYTPQKKQKL